MTPISDETAHMCRQKGKKILYSCFCTNISHNLRIKGLYFCFQVQKTELAYLVWFRFNNFLSLITSLIAVIEFINNLFN